VLTETLQMTTNALGCRMHNQQCILESDSGFQMCIVDKSRLNGWCYISQ